MKSFLLKYIGEMMYTKDQLAQKLKEKKLYIDYKRLSDYLKDWKIDPIYEDEKGVEYFDDSAIIKLKEELEGKNGNDQRFIRSLNKDKKIFTALSEVRHTELQSMDNHDDGEFKQVTVDITSHTISALSDSISKKISDDISDKIFASDFFSDFMEYAKLKRDNEILASQVKNLLEENQELKSKLNEADNERKQYKLLFGSVYIKQ